MSVVRLEPVKSTGAMCVRIRPPVPRLEGEAWKGFLDACRSSGARQDLGLQCQVVPFARAADLAKALGRAGISVEAHPDVTSAIDRERAAAGEVAQDTRQRIDSVLTEGHALWDFQREGAVWLSSRPSGILGDEPGLGKQQPIDARVATPQGWRAIGDLSVGDLVIGSSGKATRVLGVFPQGVKASYRVRFSDGSSVEAGPEHLWAVDYWRGGKRKARMMLTTDQLRLRPKIDRLNLAGVDLYLPMLGGPAEYDPIESLPIPPYALGAMIANGGMGHGGTPKIVYWSRDWPEIFSLLRGADLGKSRFYGSVTHTTVRGVAPIIRSLGLAVRSAKKRIPRLYMEARVEDRQELLWGLMDADGSISKTGNKVTYHTLSRGLADDVVELIESLGGIASVRTYDRTREGKPVEYQVRVRTPAWVAPFRVSRKASRYAPGRNSAPCRTVQSVEYVRDVESTCIKVEAEDGLYVTEHFVVTHNTPQAIVAFPPDAPVLVICPKVAFGTWVKHVLWRDDYEANMCIGRNSFRWPRRGEVRICNFEILPTLESLTAGPLFDDAPQGLIVIVDEAHYAKNLERQRAQKVKQIRILARLRGGRFWALTGTPLKNHPPDLYALIQVCGLEDETWPTEEAFNESFHGSGTDWSDDVGPEVPEILRRVMLRREKSQVLSFLPDKRWETIEIEIPKSVAQIADEAVLALQALGINLDEVIDLAQATAKMGPIQMEILSRARAALAAAKLDALLEIVGSIEQQQAFAIDEDGLPVVVSPILVWCCHRAPIDTFATRDGWATITGSVNDPKRRIEIERRFQAGELRGLALTIQAGGVAITLTRASHAIFIDLPWTPADLQQAEDRIHRISQKNACLYTYLVANHRLDKWLVRLIGHKQAIEKATVRAAAVDGTPIDVGPTALPATTKVRAAPSSRRPARTDEARGEAWIMTSTHPLAKALARQIKKDGGLTDGQWAAVMKKASEA